LRSWTTFSACRNTWCAEHRASWRLWSASTGFFMPQSRAITWSLLSARWPSIDWSWWPRARCEDRPMITRIIAGLRGIFLRRLVTPQSAAGHAHHEYA
jgi:hypothetical protein